MTALKPFVKISRCDYPYVVVDGVRTAPPVAVGMRVALAYTDTDVEGALEKVRELHPDVKITGVTNYV